MGLTHPPGCQMPQRGPHKVLLLLLERGHPTDPNPALLPPQKEGHNQLGCTYVFFAQISDKTPGGRTFTQPRLLNIVERRDLSLTIVDVSPPAC